MSSPSLAIGLGANLGDPAATLVAVRPLLAGLFAPDCRLRWSPLFRTAPVGGPPGQPDYLNAVLVVLAPSAPAPRPPEPAALPPGWPEPLDLLRRLQGLEQRFGRERRERWGPRLLDLDLLWCGEQQLEEPELRLPHPLLLQRRFVLAPLAAIDPALELPAVVCRHGGGAPRSAAAFLAARMPQLAEPPPRQLPPRPGWPD